MVEKRGQAVYFLLLMLLMVGLWGAAPKQVAAAYNDGVYEVPFVITKPDDNSVSIANDYFEKPAKIEIVNGKGTATIKVNHSAWIVSLSLPSGAELTVLASDEEQDTRIVSLPLASMADPALIQMHVLIADIGYDHEYTVRAAFDLSAVTQTVVEEKREDNLPPLAAETATQPDQPEQTTQSQEPVKQATDRHPAEITPIEQVKPKPEPAVSEANLPVTDSSLQVMSQPNDSAQAETQPATSTEEENKPQEEEQADAAQSAEPSPEAEEQDEAILEQTDQAVDEHTKAEIGTAEETESGLASQEQQTATVAAPATEKQTSSDWSKITVVGVMLILPVLLVWRWIRVRRGEQEPR